jgi:ATP synthase protein I
MPERDKATPKASPPDDLQDLDRRLSAKLAARKPARDEEDASETGQAWSIALRLSGDLLAGLAVGGGLGWMIDQVAASNPWGMLVGFGLGFAAGMRNLMRTAKQIESERLNGERTD